MPLWPEWMQVAWEYRFLERAREAILGEENEELARELEAVAAELKGELTPAQFSRLLRWENLINFRCTGEKEWLYFAGVQDGLSVLRHLLHRDENDTNDSRGST